MEKNTHKKSQLSLLKGYAEEYLRWKGNQKAVIRSSSLLFNDAQRHKPKTLVKSRLEVERINGNRNCSSSCLRFGQDWQKKKNLVFDLLSTFDVLSLNWVTVFDVLSTAGDNKLPGGGPMTWPKKKKKIIDHLVAEFKKKKRYWLSTDKMAMQDAAES